MVLGERLTEFTIDVLVFFKLKLLCKRAVFFIQIRFFLQALFWVGASFRDQLFLICEILFRLESLLVGFLHALTDLKCSD